MRIVWTILILWIVFWSSISPAFGSHMILREGDSAASGEEQPFVVRHIFLGSLEKDRLCDENGNCFMLASGVFVPQVPQHRNRIIAELTILDGKVIKVRFR